MKLNLWNCNCKSDLIKTFPLQSDQHLRKESSAFVFSLRESLQANQIQIKNSFRHLLGFMLRTKQCCYFQTISNSLKITEITLITFENAKFMSQKPIFLVSMSEWRQLSDICNLRRRFCRKYAGRNKLFFIEIKKTEGMWIFKSSFNFRAHSEIACEIMHSRLDSEGLTLVWDGLIYIGQAYRFELRCCFCRDHLPSGKCKWRLRALPAMMLGDALHPDNADRVFQYCSKASTIFFTQNLTAIINCHHTNK